MYIYIYTHTYIIHVYAIIHRISTLRRITGVYHHFYSCVTGGTWHVFFAQLDEKRTEELEPPNSGRFPSCWLSQHYWHETTESWPNESLLRRFTTQVVGYPANWEYQFTMVHECRTKSDGNCGGASDLKTWRSTSSGIQCCFKHVQTVHNLLASSGQVTAQGIP